MIAPGSKVKRRAHASKPGAAIGVVIGLYDKHDRAGVLKETRARVNWPDGPEGNHALTSLVVVDAGYLAQAAEDNAAILAPPAFVGTVDELEGWLAAAGAPEAVSRDPIAAVLEHDQGGRTPRTEWRGDPGEELREPSGVIVTPRMLEAAREVMALPVEAGTAPAAVAGELVDARAPDRVLVTLRWTETEGRRTRHREQRRLGVVVERGPDVVRVDVPGHGVLRCWPSDVEAT